MQDLSKYKNDGVLFDGHYRLIKLLSTEGGTADVWLAENYESIDTKLSEDNDDVIRVDGTGVLVAKKYIVPRTFLMLMVSRALGLNSKQSSIVTMPILFQQLTILYATECHIWSCRFVIMVLLSP